MDESILSLKAVTLNVGDCLTANCKEYALHGQVEIKIVQRLFFEGNIEYTCEYNTLAHSYLTGRVSTYVNVEDTIKDFLASVIDQITGEIYDS